MTLVCPSAVRTPIMKNSSRVYFSSDEDAAAAMKFMNRFVDTGMHPEKLAKKIVKAIQKNQYLVTTTGVLKAVVIAKAFVPSAGFRFSSLVSRTLRRVYGKK